jgi:hypothetical protein
MNNVKKHRFCFCVDGAKINPEARTFPQDEQDQTMHTTSELLISALNRQRSLRVQGGHFDERALLQSEIHGLRASLRRPDPGRRP